MQTVDDKPETIHLYVVRECNPRPSIMPVIIPVIILVVALSTFAAIGLALLYPQPEQRASIRVPAVLLPPRTFTVQAQVTPTGVRTYPATTAHGILTITNGSVISQTIPQGFRLENVITDKAVFVPAGSADGYGYAVVSAHAAIAGTSGNIPALAIDTVEGSSVYVRNLTAFHGGRDAYSVKVMTTRDRQTALDKARQHLAVLSVGLHYPCSETVSGAISVIWRCQFVTYHIPSYMHVTGVTIIGKNLLVAVWFVARPVHIWVK